MRTDYLFAQPSFLTGWGRLIDLFGLLTVYNDSLPDADADAQAIYADWCVVGSDLNDAMESFGGEAATSSEHTH